MQKPVEIKKLDEKNRETDKWQTESSVKFLFGEENLQFWTFKDFDSTPPVSCRKALFYKKRKKNKKNVEASNAGFRIDFEP